MPTMAPTYNNNNTILFILDQLELTCIVILSYQADGYAIHDDNSSKIVFFGEPI